MAELKINGKVVPVNAPDDTPLLWVLREDMKLTGTKFGCGIGSCGACTVHIDGSAEKSCLVTLGDVQGREVKTIEGLARGESLHPCQKAWLEECVSQCGYCQPGQIMRAAALLAENQNPSDADIDQAMAGNLCRCGTYPRIRKAIKRAAQMGG